MWVLFQKEKKSKLYYPILHYTYTLTVEQKVSVIYKHIHELSFLFSYVFVPRDIQNKWEQVMYTLF